MIRVKELQVHYGSHEVLRGLDVEIHDCDFTVLAGPNGAGKSTLLYTIMGYHPASGGSVHLYDKPIGSYKPGELASLISFVPQESVFSFDFRVEELVLMGRYPFMGIMQAWTEEDREVARQAMGLLRLEGFAQRWYSQLSGGEKQRVLIARALAQETRYIFLDESLSQLDINHQVEIMRLLSKIHSEKQIGILLVSHNLNLAANFADSMIFLKDGRVMGHGSPGQLMTPEALGELYGLELEVVANPLSGVPNLIYPGKTRSAG
ncbi:MAG TPA: ABC transporter ATP-binding protein [Candidatus Cloacimonadota bacterium]|nr:ABC transporter ATP-binding protein [Candidatus Cloacimonadota bacterium]HPS38109.1 ABC transporter ATP-binding protein [Candidatus Cloacimonadota bacterium]